MTETNKPLNSWALLSAGLATISFGAVFPIRVVLGAVSHMQLEVLVGIGGMLSATSFAVGARAALDTLTKTARARGRVWTMYGLAVSAIAMMLWLLLAEAK